MAKGLEDTAIYRYNRLVSLNEVGAHPDRFSLSVAAFHDSNQRRLATHPHCMVATSTHDTKRGEDLRAIVGSIADELELWADSVAEWRSMLAAADQDAIHPNDLYLFFQLLLGGWPVEAAVEGLAERLKGAMIKSLREARQRSDWGVNNVAYEARLADFVDQALTGERFLGSFHATRGKLQAIGRRKAIIQVALKLTIPGVPDIYRGAEDWEQSFVDPDNRRPLDFATLERRLATPEAGQDDKLVLTQSLLRFRRERPSLFAEGSYEPVDHGASTLAFRRRLGQQEVLVIADLSRRHNSPLNPPDIGLHTVAGSAAGPIWVLRN